MDVDNMSIWDIYKYANLAQIQFKNNETSPFDENEMNFRNEVVRGAVSEFYGEQK